MAKRGPKPSWFTCNWNNNETVSGLVRRPDGRWKAYLPDGTLREFRCDDERQAVTRFYSLKESAEDKPFATPVAVIAKDATGEEAAKAVKIAHAGDDARPDDDEAEYLFGDRKPPTGKTAFTSVIKLDAQGNLLFTKPGQERALCMLFSNWLRTRRQWLANTTGWEQLAYLTEVKPPTPLPSFAAIEKVWEDFYVKNAEQKRKVLHSWKDFKTTTKAEKLADITPELVISYRDNVYGRKLTGKSQSNLFTRIRRLFSFAKDRAIAVDELAKRLEYLALLTPSETTVSLDPKPITRADWDKLYGKAEGDDKAMVLLMLNCGMYIQEAINLRWDDIKEEKYLIVHRRKTGKCLRIAVLWDETIQALKEVKRRGEFIFIADHGGQIGIKGAELRFRSIREEAGVAHVCGSHLRDGAATAAAEASEDQRIVDLLLGHRSGIKDHYAKRKPSMVAPACEAVRKAYFG